MAIEKMKLVQVSGTKESLDKFITSCCISGDFHPENAMNYLSGSLGFSSLNEENPYTASIQKIEEIASIANVTLEESYSDNEISFDFSELEFVDNLKNTLNLLFSERTEIAEKLENINKSIEQFSHFKNLDVPLEEIFATEFLKVRFGKIPIDCYPKLKAYENNKDIMFFDCSQDSKNHWGLYIAPCSKVEEVDRIFASLYFERIKIAKETGTPEQITDKLAVEQKELSDRLSEIDSKISSFWNENSVQLEGLYAHLKILDMAFGLRRYAVTDKSGTYFVYIGWVPYSSVKWFNKRIAKLEDVECEEFEANENTHSDPPVKLKNHKIFRPFEMFVEMYGLPSYDGFDITPFVAITYILLFGIMFADMGQGFVLALGGFLIYKFKKVKLAKLIVPCGISSMIFGFLVGSVFGYEDWLDPVYTKMNLESKPLDVMGSIETVLLIAIGIGIALVVAAMLLNVYRCIRNKNIGEALFSQNGVTGIVLYLSLVAAVVSFMSETVILPSWIIAIIAVACLIILFFKEIIIGKIDGHQDYMPESLSDYIMQNIFEVIEYILTYFSNTVSFLRVGAFVLVHAGMMMVFSSIASNPHSIAGVIAMIFGNLIVIALEGLLTGIQVLRLEYYEMFSRFYEGDGKPFMSIGSKRNRNFMFKINSASFKATE